MFGYWSYLGIIEFFFAIYDYNTSRGIVIRNGFRCNNKIGYSIRWARIIGE